MSENIFSKLTTLYTNDQQSCWHNPWDIFLENPLTLTCKWVKSMNRIGRNIGFRKNSHDLNIFWRNEEDGVRRSVSVVGNQPLWWRRGGWANDDWHRVQDKVTGFRNSRIHRQECSQRATAVQWTESTEYFRHRAW